MSTETELVTISRPVPAPTSSIDQTARNPSPGSGPSDSQAPAQASPSIPKLKVLAAAFSFLCAGIDGATLGPLLPYVIKSFTIGTGEVAIMYVVPIVS